MFWAEIWKISEFLSENFHFLAVKFSVYLDRHVFVMGYFVTVCSPSPFLSMPRSDCGSWVWHFLGIFTYIWRAKWKKRPLCHMRTTKIQVSIHIRAVWSQHSLFVDIYYSFHWFCKRATKALISMCEFANAQADQGLHWLQNASRLFQALRIIFIYRCRLPTETSPFIIIDNCKWSFVFVYFFFKLHSYF